jgi:hypothetical protein
MASTKRPKKSTAPGHGHGIKTPAPKLPKVGTPATHRTNQLPATRRGGKK